MNRFQQRVVALAGVAQCSALVQQLARRGHAQEDPFGYAVRSVLALDRKDPQEALGGIGGFISDCPNSPEATRTLWQ